MDRPAADNPPSRIARTNTAIPVNRSATFSNYRLKVLGISSGLSRADRGAISALERSTEAATHLLHIARWRSMFFMDDSQGVWTGMETFLRDFPMTLSEKPKAILVVSCHWETDGFSFTGAEQFSLIYDYYGFPAQTYGLRYEAPGAPKLADRATALLQDAGLMASIDTIRGFDGVFVPLKWRFPTR